MVVVVDGVSSHVCVGVGWCLFWSGHVGCFGGTRHIINRQTTFCSCSAASEGAFLQRGRESALLSFLS